MRKAIVDVGSNSVILLIAENTDGKWEFIEEFTQVTALGENTKQTGLLGEAGIASTLKALRDFEELARRCGVFQIEAWATMAARIARNTPVFQDRAAAQGTPVSVLSGEQEAQLGFESVVYDPAFSGHNIISIFDPGGQSTELVTAKRQGSGWETAFRRSFPVGTLGLRGGRLANEAPTPADLLGAVAELDDTIGLEYLPGAAGTAVVLGASGTNLISIRDQLKHWNPRKVHGATLRYDEVSRFVSDLSALGDAGRAALVGIEPGRERTVHLGALVLERFMYMTHVLEVRVSVRGWRHALIERSS